MLNYTDGEEEDEEERRRKQPIKPSNDINLEIEEKDVNLTKETNSN